MRMGTIFLLSVSSVWLAGCYPMEQASLVYASTSVYGANVTTGSVESPGLIATVGHRAKDAAYVPVAVAKYCDQRTSSDCEDEVYKLIPIDGQRTDLSENSTSKEALAALEDARETFKAEVAQYNTRLQQLEQDEAARNALRSQRSQIEPQLTTLQEELQQQFAGTDAAEAVDQTAQREDLNQRIEALIASRTSIDAKLADYQNLDQRVSDARTNLKEAEAKLDRVLAQIRLANEERAMQNWQRTDARSVFGSFNGDAGGDEEAVGIAMGKVFSTGIAAQNLTQGMQEAQAVAETRKCIASAVGDLMDVAAADRRALLDLATRLCAVHDHGD